MSWVFLRILIKSQIGFLRVYAETLVTAKYNDRNTHGRTFPSEGAKVNRLA